ncbi:MAG TPA: MFS transporter [Candidatus Bathyarchaeia archaeon]|nr:MFS transporter [Candidatus Bathyarchaeia archaeon]
MKLPKSVFNDSYFLVLCVMGAFAILSSTMSKSPVLNPFAKSLNTPPDLLGLIASVSTIPGILISLPAASLSDIVGRRKMLLFSAFAFASAPFMYLLVTTWWQLALVRFYHGFATAVFVPVTEATVAERFPLKRGERISILNSATGIGRTIAPILGGTILTAGGTIIISANYAYQSLYLAVAVAGVTACILAFLLLSEKKNSATPVASIRNVSRKMFQGWREIALNKSAIIVSFVQAGQYYVYGAVEFFLVGYMVEVAKLDALFAGLFLSVNVATLIISRPILGRISDKHGRHIPILLGVAITIPAVLAIPFTIQFPLLLLISVVYGLGFAMVISSTSPLMSELSPQGLVGASMGFLCTMMDIGQTLGPFVSGVVLASFSHQYAPLFASLSLMLLTTGIVFLLSSRTSQSKTQAQIALKRMRLSEYRNSFKEKHNSKTGLNACSYTPASEQATWKNQSTSTSNS